MLRLAEILDETITTIINASDKVIYLAWSGGVDSTALACAFLKNGLERRRLHVLMSESSVDEYPDFLRLLQKEGVTTTMLSASTAFSILSNTTKEGLLCMGWGADQLFGSVVNNYYPDWFKKKLEGFLSVSWCFGYGYSSVGRGVFSLWPPCDEFRAGKLVGEFFL